MWWITVVGKGLRLGIKPVCGSRCVQCSLPCVEPVETLFETVFAKEDRERNRVIEENS